MGTWSIQGNNAYIQSTSVTGDNLSVVFKPNTGNTQQGNAQNFTITYNDDGNVTTTSYTLPYCYVPAPEQHEDMFEVNFNTLPQGFEYSNTGDTHTVLVTSGTWSESTQNYVFSPVNISFLNSDGLSFAADSRGSGGGITRSYSVHLSESPENRTVEGIEMKIQQANNPSNYSSRTFDFRAEEAPSLETNLVSLLYGYNNNGVFVGVLERQVPENVSLTYGGGYHVTINKTCTDSAESSACPASQNYEIKAAGITIQTNSDTSDAFPFFGINEGAAQSVPECCIGQADGDQVTNPTMVVTLVAVPDAYNAIELTRVNDSLIPGDGYDTDEFHYEGFVTNAHYADLKHILKGKVYNVQYNNENNSSQTTYIYDFDDTVYVPTSDGYEVCTSITQALSTISVAPSNVTAIQQFSPKLGELVGNQLQLNADGTLTEKAVLDDDLLPSPTRAIHIELKDDNNN